MAESLLDVAAWGTGVGLESFKGERKAQKLSLFKFTGQRNCFFHAGPSPVLSSGEKSGHYLSPPPALSSSLSSSQPIFAASLFIFCSFLCPLSLPEVEGEGSVMLGSQEIFFLHFLLIIYFNHINYDLEIK